MVLGPAAGQLALAVASPALARPVIAAPAQAMRCGSRHFGAVGHWA
jgi:hypothetical protein